MLLQQNRLWLVKLELDVQAVFDANLHLLARVRFRGHVIRVHPEVSFLRYFPDAAHQSHPNEVSDW